MLLTSCARKYHKIFTNPEDFFNSQTTFMVHKRCKKIYITINFMAPGRRPIQGVYQKRPTSRHQVTSFWLNRRDMVKQL